MGELTLVEETDKGYIIKDQDGKQKTIYKIKSCTKKRIKELQKASLVMEKNDFKVLVSLCEEVLNVNDNEILNNWFEIAKRLTEVMKIMYDKIGRPNSFHYFVKNVNPDVYGRGDTIRKHCKNIRDFCFEIANEMIKIGKLEKCEDTTIKEMVTFHITVPKEEADTIRNKIINEFDYQNLGITTDKKIFSSNIS